MASPTWIQHFEGASRMIEMRGGLKAFADHPYLRRHIDYLLMCVRACPALGHMADV